MNYQFLKSLFACGLLILSTQSLFSQTPAKWNVNGNTTAPGEFLGTLNNEPLIFKTNGSEAMRLKPNGELRLNNLSGFGDGLVTVNNNGTFGMTAFPGDTTKVFTGAGVFRSIYSISGWKRVGNNVVNNNGAFVGIGTNNPQYILDVNGTVRFNGIVNATGINIVNMVQADTVKGARIISVNNNLNLSAGLYNEIYTYNGDVKIQSRLGYNGNTVFNAGTNGNVGIGTNTPQYKLDVNGDARLNGRTQVFRIVPLNGDSLIRFGDSTIYINSSQNLITTSIVGVRKGLGIGWGLMWPYGRYSLCIGSKLEVSDPATYSIAMGVGALNGNRLINNIPTSLMIAFNSDISTLFVGPANGVGTVGKVGVGTTNPQADLQIGNGGYSVSMGPTFGVPLYSTSYLGLNVSRVGLNQWKVQGNGLGNGGIAMLGTLNGSLEIVSFPATGITDQVFTDADLASHNIFEIRPDGKVVIGQNPEPIITPGTYRLYVSDGIITEKLKVVAIANWSDDVFDSTYILNPLDSVSAFIRENHHLPGVPSAADVKLNGIDVAESDAILLAKIEELTLYMIQLQEQNAKQQKEIDELKNKK
ncbi:MAG: hypothetical protein ABIQ40_05365 [Bacteroidia bacterium]